ncbi:hypothetical protein AKJ09_04067 [Labilithrix luteola]|uniref:Uncharacterized protein n=1 Tax=Labilithrix luteola TaxID=1391654 RepID=A0A0K1PV39_9BACT|nr:hypothetical protein AKJ09_04067 [Labilithrix luteola]
MTALLIARTAAATERTTFGPATVDVTIGSSDDPHCPTETAFLDAVRASLAAAPGEEPPPAARFDIDVTSTPEGAIGHLVSRPEGGETSFERSVRGATCREAAEAIALVLVTSIHPLAAPVDLSSTPEPPPAPPPPPPQPPQTPAKRPAPKPPVHEGPVVFGLRASAGMLVGIQPGVTGGIDLEGVARLRRAPVELRLGGGVYLPTDKTVAGGTVEFWDVRPRADVCVSPEPAPGSRSVTLVFGGCGGASVDVVFTKARDFQLVASTTTVIPSLTVGGFGGVAFGPKRRFRAGVEGELGFPLAPATWNVISLGEVHRTSPVTVRPAGFFAVHFP